ncbi:MAG: tetratricopeptide repeat protein [Bacteroidota bacterium]
MKKSILIIAGFIAVLTACQSPKEKALKEIDTLEVQDSTFSMENMAKLRDAYVTYAEKYPDDERSPEFLFKAGQRCSVLASQNNDSKQHLEAVKLFQRIRTNYPKHHMAEESMFLTGYIYENHLGDTAKARRTYIEFIAAYPDGELAEEANLALRNIDVPLDQIIGQQKLQKEDTTTFVKK